MAVTAVTVVFSFDFTTCGRMLEERLLSVTAYMNIPLDRETNLGKRILTDPRFLGVHEEQSIM